MTDTKYQLIAQAKQNSAEIPPAELPAPGAPARLVIVANRENETRNEAARLRDRSNRSFLVDLLLAKQPMSWDLINGNFSKEDGGSYIKFGGSDENLRVGTSYGTFEVEFNSKRELALIKMRVEASDPFEAAARVNKASVAFLDNLSYIAQAPIFPGLMRIEDEKNQTLTIEMVGPEREVTITAGRQNLFVKLAPIYALYREFKNSSSAYYRLLCLYKIMEGILSVLRPSARKEAKEYGLKFSIPKETVPNHKDIAEELRQFIGRSIAWFYNNVVQKEYRDAVSHFLIREDAILNVSSIEERDRYAKIAFVCELCVRVLIANHEDLIRQLIEALSARSEQS
jgi:hypothetical protein